MSNRKIVVNWLRDSIIGFGLILLAIAIANSLHALVWFHHPKLYWCWFAVGIVPFCLFARWRGVSSFDTWTQILRWIGVIPVAIVGHQFASLGMLHLWSFCSSLIASVLSSDAAAVLQKFVTAPLMWAIVAAVSTCGDRRAKRTHFGKLIGVENGPTVVVSGDFESFRFRALGVKDAYGGRLRTDQACSS
jgi:hypothetical protein